MDYSANIDVTFEVFGIRCRRCHHEVMIDGALIRGIAERFVGEHHDHLDMVDFHCTITAPEEYRGQQCLLSLSGVTQ